MRSAFVPGFRSRLRTTIASKVSIWAACTRLGVVLKRPDGEDQYVLCPLHHEDTPSCRVYGGDDQHFHCFGCGAHGDVLDLACGVLDVGVFDAVKWFEAEFGVEVVVSTLPSADELAIQHRERTNAEGLMSAYEKEAIRASGHRVDFALWGVFDQTRGEVRRGLKEGMSLRVEVLREWLDTWLKGVNDRWQGK